ncbi:hypothetical protein [Nocardia asiatica]|uniref:hypothetical protein n=1 Tax=Nocardia asiatica TaxID=209252 RepID=UPI002456A073|nr:hypothetical protein [Nocardia asiatica]
MAAAVPLLGVADVTFIPPEDIPAVIVPLIVLCAGSAVAAGSGHAPVHRWEMT